MRILREDANTSIFSSKRTLRSELVKVKKRVDQSDRKGVVYEIECFVVILTSERQVEQDQGTSLRIYAVRRYNSNNGISVHANDNMKL